MNDCCEACGGAITGGEPRCPYCGIRFLAEADGIGATDPRGAQVQGSVDPLSLVPDGLAGPSLPVPDAGAVPGAGPATPLRWKRWLLITVAISVLGAAAGWAVRQMARDPAVRAAADAVPDDEWFERFTALEAYLQRVLDSGALRRADEAVASGVDGLLERIRDRHRRGDPRTLEKATAAHVPLIPGPGQTLHEFFDAYVRRLAQIDPGWVLLWGRHPHPTAFTWQDDAVEARAALLHSDVLKALAEWPGGHAVTPHDRVDLEMFRDTAEQWIAWAALSGDSAYLDEVVRWFDELEMLAAVACCPEKDRAAAATGRLRFIADMIDQVIREAGHPPRAAVERVLARIPDWLVYLADYPERWLSVDAGRPAELRREAVRVKAALDSLGISLREEVLAKANGLLGRGPDYYDLLLCRWFRLSGGAEPLFRYALKEFSAAWCQSRRIGLTLPLPETGGVRSKQDSLAIQVERLSRYVSTWVSPGPRLDPGVSVSRLPRVLTREPGRACYVGPAALVEDSPSVIMENDRGGRNFLLDRIRIVHTAAHEAYPGHHLQSLLSRESACRLRRALASTMAVEGWSVYAEDVMHESVGCPPGLEHDYVLASERLARAWDAMLDILIQARAAPPEQVIAWMRLYRGEIHVKESELGEAAAMPGLGVAYLAGYREVLRLRDEVKRRQGASFDLRRFHDRLLRCGPVPPQLLIEEMTGP
jgi:hypothetical protein